MGGLESAECVLVRVVIEHLRFAVSWATTEPLRLGRALDNDVVLSRPFISGHHLRLTTHEGGLLADDLGSRNGCWLDGVRLEGPTPVLLGQRLFLGSQTHIVVIRPASEPVGMQGWALCRANGSLVARLGKGSHPLALISGQPGAAGTLVLREGRSPELKVGSVAVALPLDEPFEVDGEYFLILRDRSRSSTATVTDGPMRVGVRCEVEVRNAYTVPKVCVTDVQTKRRCVFRPSHAATLLMLLAERAMESTPRPGWVSDDDLRVGLWGRAGLQNDPNNLNVVIYRIRRRLRGAGLNSELVCKEPQWTRLDRARVSFSSEGETPKGTA